MPQHAHYHHPPQHHHHRSHSPSLTPGRLFWSILKSAMSSAIIQKRPNVSLGFLKVNVWQTNGGFRPINKSRSMSTVRCRSDWFLSRLSSRCLSLPLRSHSRWILWAQTQHTHRKGKRKACVYLLRMAGRDMRARAHSHSCTRAYCTVRQHNTPNEPARAWNSFGL